MLNTSPVRALACSALTHGRGRIPGVRIAILLTVWGALALNAPLCVAVVDPITPTADAALSGISKSDAEYIFRKMNNDFHAVTDDGKTTVRTTWNHQSHSTWTEREWWITGIFSSRHKLDPFDQTCVFEPSSAVYITYTTSNNVGTLRIQYQDGGIDRNLRYGVSKTRLISTSNTTLRSGAFDFTDSPLAFGIKGSYTTSNSNVTEKVNVTGLSYRDRKSITITNNPLIVKMTHQWDSDTHVSADVTLVDVKTHTITSGTVTVKFADGHIEGAVDNLVGHTMTTNTSIGNADVVSDQAWMSSAIYLTPTRPNVRAYQQSHVVFNLDVANTPMQYLISKNWDKWPTPVFP